jgi:hypothetical protein
MWLPDQLHRMRLILLFMLLCVVCAGCVHRVYVGPELPVPIGELGRPPVPQMLNLQVKCSFPEAPSGLEGVFCTRIRSSTQKILVDSKLFSEFVPAENLDQMALDFELKRDSYSSRTWPALIALVPVMGTFGTLGFTETGEDWNLAAAYTPVNRSAISRQYHLSTYRSVGLILLTSPPSGSREVRGNPFAAVAAATDGLESELGEVVRDLVLNFLRDLQQSGEL